MMQLPNYKDVTAERPEDTFDSGKLLTQQLVLMQNDKVSGSGSNPGQEPFITIDDLVEKAQDLFRGLSKLSEYKYPLDVRRGIRKGVEKTMNEDKQSMQIKGSGRTYFFDIEKTKDDKLYLRITESRKGDADKWERNNINVFPEDADEFAQAVSEMTAKLS